jgi:hypothetical protein
MKYLIEEHVYVSKGEDLLSHQPVIKYICLWNHNNCIRAQTKTNT